MKWAVLLTGTNAPVHVVPVDDLSEHTDAGLQCWCDPKVEWVDRGWVVIHNSADGRELIEQHGVQ